MRAADAAGVHLVGVSVRADAAGVHRGAGPAAAPDATPDPSPSPNPNPNQVFTEVLGPLQHLMESELTRRILRAVPLLSHLTEAERDGVISQLKETKYAPTEFIIRQVREI